MPSDWFKTQSIASCSRGRPSPRRPVEASLPELRLALGREVHLRRFVLEDVETSSDGVERLLEPLRPDQLEVVCGRVVLGKLTLERAREAAHGQVESRRVVLPLIPAPRDEVEDSSFRTAAHDVRAARSTSASSPPAPLVRERRRSRPHRRRQGQPTTCRARPRSAPARRSSRSSLGRRAIGTRAPRPAASTAASSVRSAMPERLSFASDGWHTWVVEQNLVVALAREEALAVRQRSRRERAVDDDLVRVVVELVERSLRQAEPPCARVVRRSVRDPVRAARRARAGSCRSSSSVIVARTGSL